MNIDQARQSIYMALCDYTETCLSGDDNEAVRSEVQEAWHVLLEHVVPVEWAVYRHDRKDVRLDSEELVLRGFKTARAAYEAANALRRLSSFHRYTVGEL